MDFTPDRAASAVERHDCPNCDAPAGSVCRTRGGKTAAKYHTPRFVLVPALREELEVLVPADRRPGRAWKQGPALAVVPAPRTERPVRIGYARTSTARQELASQLEALHRAECHKVFQEQISTRVKVRPELEKALALAHQFKEAAPETPVILTVHELKRLARNAAELMTLSAELQAGGIQLELLTGPLTGIYDPNGMGAMFFAVLAVAGQIERNYIREKTLEGQVIAASKGNHGGRPKVIDDDMLTFAVALKDKGVPVPEIAKKLTIKTGKNAGKSPSVASLYRALAEAEEAAADDSLPLRPTRVRVRRPEDPSTPEEIDLRERLQAQPHPNTELR
ncbi:recombinase family protein [Streptomyces sp. AM 3-1-1]|uniref:recombinase family protein n=1 Tax=Streptomyces sp. AM 3-1-1 TaxID=3028711 RepID=UPI0023B93974|nr:recombinase family protein [Streptomyces sp. AM 3-1-1]WEH29138.1 recombinase family protein [Streptomyces sp. AM 3-1-1]